MSNDELYKITLATLYEAFPDKPPYISLNAAAKYCRTDARRLEADRSFPKKRLGKGTVVPLPALARWLTC